MKKKQTAVDVLVSILNKENFAPVLTNEEIQHFKQMVVKKSVIMMQTKHLRTTTMKLMEKLKTK